MDREALRHTLDLLDELAHRLQESTAEPLEEKTSAGKPQRYLSKSTFNGREMRYSTFLDNAKAEKRPKSVAYWQRRIETLHKRYHTDQARADRESVKPTPKSSSAPAASSPAPAPSASAPATSSKTAPAAPASSSAPSKPQEPPPKPPAGAAPQGRPDSLKDVVKDLGAAWRDAALNGIGVIAGATFGKVIGKQRAALLAQRIAKLLGRSLKGIFGHSDLPAQEPIIPDSQTGQPGSSPTGPPAYVSHKPRRKSSDPTKGQNRQKAVGNAVDALRKRYGAGKTDKSVDPQERKRRKTVAKKVAAHVASGTMPKGVQFDRKGDPFLRMGNGKRDYEVVRMYAQNARDGGATRILTPAETEKNDKAAQLRAAERERAAREAARATAPPPAEKPKGRRAKRAARRLAKKMSRRKSG